MKFNCGRRPLSKADRQAQDREAYLARIEASREWQDVFAWLPVRVGENDCRWFEVVQRRAVGGQPWSYPDIGEMWQMYSPFAKRGCVVIPWPAWITPPKIEYRAKDKPSE